MDTNDVCPDLDADPHGPHITVWDADLFTVTADVIVNPVNCVGTSGAGLAKEFARRWPEADARYRRWCASGLAAPGRILYHDEQRGDGAVRIVYAPTKRHWRDPSALADVAASARAVAREVAHAEARSVAVPALGCGLGGLAWEEAEPVLRAAFAGSRARVVLIPPRVDAAPWRRAAAQPVPWKVPAGGSVAEATVVLGVRIADVLRGRSGVVRVDVFDEADRSTDALSWSPTGMADAPTRLHLAARDACAAARTVPGPDWSGGVAAHVVRLREDGSPAGYAVVAQVCAPCARAPVVVARLAEA